MTVISVSKLVHGQSSYPNWSTGKKYCLQSCVLGNKTEVFYIITQGSVHRRISRLFPSSIFLTYQLSWCLGFYKGEGISSIKSHSYKRFRITNKNTEDLLFFLKTLSHSGLLDSKDNLHFKVEIHHSSKPSFEVITYWSRQLHIPFQRIVVRSYNHNLTKSEYGVCNLIFNDVLLRRIFDLLIISVKKSKGHLYSGGRI